MVLGSERSEKAIVFTKIWGFFFIFFLFVSVLRIAPRESLRSLQLKHFLIA